ncbi:hypothetical protein [Zobellella sp. DQSA1]|uniref:hypothetical protein n=1 Tax=Zobellella sp. DQSA1 TaxID=3342386 RepID=UPI0035C1961C
MNLQSVSCCLPEYLSQLDPRPYGYARPVATAGSVGIEFLKIAADQALEMAQCKAKDIDLIVSLSWSPDHMIDDPAIMGPRVGHPLQKLIGATNAFVFDMMDASLAKTLHIINHFALMQSMRRVLVVRMDVGHGLSADETSGFRIPDGAFALVLSPDQNAQFHRQNISGDFQPLKVDLRSNILSDKGIKASFSFPYQESLCRSVEETYRYLSHFGGPTRRYLCERWFSDESHNKPCLGPFELPFQLHHECTPSESYLVVSFDPFNLSVEATTLSRKKALA